MRTLLGMKSRILSHDLIRVPKAIRLRERAADLKEKAEEMLRESAALLASAEELETELQRGLAIVRQS
jgi:predicted nuclease with TOPRIM domain